VRMDRWPPCSAQPPGTWYPILMDGAAIQVNITKEGEHSYEAIDPSHSGAPIHCLVSLVVPALLFLNGLQNICTGTSTLHGKTRSLANKAFARLLHVTYGTKGVRFDGRQAHQATAGCRMGTIWTIDLTRLVGVAPTGILRGHSTSRFLSNLLAGLTSNDRIV
jgi:hypothetical protein